MTRFITNSSVTTFKRCRRKWWLSERWGYAPITETSMPLSVGSAVHELLDTYYSAPDRAELEADRSWIHKPLLAHLDATLAANDPATAEEQPLSFIDKDKAEALTLATIMVDGYLDWLAETGADAGLTIIAAETALSAPFQPAVGYEPVTLLAKLDLRVQTDNGRLAFLDHKTVANMVDLPKVAALQEQPLMYGLLLMLTASTDGPHAGQVPEWMIYNMLRKVKRTARANPPFYGRHEVRHNMASYQAYLAQLSVIAVQIEQLLTDGGEQLMPIQATPSPSSTCSWECPFVGVCPQFNDGGDPAYVLGSGFTQRPPLERYVDLK